MVCGVCEEHEEPGNPSALKPYEKRRTTDILFLIAIIALWIVMTIVGAVSIPEGNPYRLFAPVDDKVSDSLTFLFRVSSDVLCMGN